VGSRIRVKNAGAPTMAEERMAAAQRIEFVMRLFRFIVTPDGGGQSEKLDE